MGNRLSPAWEIICASPIQGCTLPGLQISINSSINKIQRQANCQQWPDMTLLNVFLKHEACMLSHSAPKLSSLMSWSMLQPNSNALYSNLRTDQIGRSSQAINASEHNLLQPLPGRAPLSAAGQAASLQQHPQTPQTRHLTPRPGQAQLRWHCHGHQPPPPAALLG